MFLLQLIDLLGIEKFELITQILQFRKELVIDYQCSTAAASAASKDGGISYNDAFIPPPIMPQKKKQPPAFGQQIVIQSGLEKQLQKELRKEEKKLTKYSNQSQQGGGDTFMDRAIAENRNIEDVRKK